MTWKQWLIGLFGAFISGLATAIATTIVDPSTFNFSGPGLVELAKVTMAVGIVSIAKYILQNKVPGLQQPQANSVDVAKAVISQAAATGQPVALTVAPKP